jgi:hypothetical protein
MDDGMALRPKINAVDIAVSDPKAFVVRMVSAFTFLRFDGESPRQHLAIRSDDGKAERLGNIGKVISG